MKDEGSGYKDLARTLEQKEKKDDAQFKAVFDAIRQLIDPSERKKGEIGLKREKK